MSNFERENRYIVIKRSDLETIPNRQVVNAFLASLAEVSAHSCRIPQRQFLVIESDWPEYEPVWQTLEARVTGVEEVHTDCRSQEGVTVGLVDTVINCARLLKHRPATPAVEQALQDLRADEDVATLLADPVPPAGGEPEVYGFWCAPKGKPNLGVFHRLTHMTEGEYPDSFRQVTDITVLVDRAHVTRLQAEVESLKKVAKAYIASDGDRSLSEHALRAELTKARELLTADYQLLGLNSSLVSYREQMKAIATFLSNQSAPADDCAHSEANKHGCPECGEEFKSADKGQANPEHTLFNEIRISDPFNEDGEPTRYLITEAQLQRIRALEAGNGQGEPVTKYAEAVPKFKFDTLVEHCKRLERDVYELLAEVNDAWLYKENAVWFWQHDGEDYLKSLSCPVVIPAGQLRELLDGKAQHDPMAEQPAPVAVVMPLALGLNDGPYYSNTQAPELGYLAGWKACLDEVARLNPIKQ